MLFILLFKIPEQATIGGIMSPFYRDMGFSEADIEEIRRLKRARQAGGEAVLFRRVFKKELDASLLQNLSRIGLLNERARERLGGMGIRVRESA